MGQKMYRDDKRDEDFLKKELRKLSAIIFMPNKVFNILMRAISNEKFELDDESSDYFLNLTDGERLETWHPEIYNIVKNEIVPLINN